MYYPLVGERVWVSGCTDEFIVTRTDYGTCTASISLAKNQVLSRRAPFFLLFALKDFEAAQAGVAQRELVRDVVRSSQVCIHQAKVALRDLRDTTKLALETIRRSQAMIAETDATVRRWQRLGCKSEEKDGQVA